MNITSMDMNSLFHTLMGKAPSRPVMDLVRGDAGEKKFVQLDEDLNTAMANANNAKKDTFTKKSDEITPVADSVDRLLDYDTTLDMRIRAGMTRAQLATHFGDIARRLDTAYSEGKFTKEEYDELNAGLMESYDKYISRCEYSAAGQQVGIIRAIERRRQLFAENGNDSTETAPKRKRNIDRILEGMKEHRMSLRERHKLQETATVLAMLAALERNSGGDDSKWKKLAEDLRESLREAVKNVENNDVEAAEPVKIPEKAQESAPEKSEESEESGGETLGGRKIQPSIDPETVKRIGEEIHQQTTKFAAQHCTVDRGQMRAMLETVRRGGFVAGGRDNTSGGERYKDWYNEGYEFQVYM